jgi:hypothetical protein
VSKIATYEKIERLQRDGWVFFYEKNNRVLGVYHPGGGRVNLIEFKSRSILVDCCEVGVMLAGSLNRKKEKCR